MLELTMYMLIPWVLGLSWSICFHLSLATMVWPVGHGSGQIPTSEDPAWSALSLVMWYLATFFPNIIAGYLYFRRNRDYGWVRSFALGHLLPLYNYISYLSAWRAVGRILRGRTNWDKTPRVGDRTPTSPTSPAPPP
jgi:1,2-diacylglycerol 3-beta-glucosyltransferase